MEAHRARRPARTPSALEAIATIGLIAGTLDIAAAFVHYYIATGGNPIRVLDYIASGVFGAAAYEHSALMATVGLALHYAIATSFAAIFFLAYPRVALLRHHPILAGLSYAVVVWVIMNLIVVPLSRAPRSPMRLESALIALAVLVFAIGLPISLLTHRHHARQTTPPPP